VASIFVQILDKEIVKTTFTINAASHTQNVPTKITYKEYTVRILFKYKHLEYVYNCTMSPVGKHLPIQIANNVISIKNPNQHHRFVVKYRIHTFSSHRSGKLPLRIWISPGKHRIEFFKQVWFWHTWVQYAQWTQDFEITTYDPKILFLAEKLVTTTSIVPTTIVNKVVLKVIITIPMITSTISPITLFTTTAEPKRTTPEAITTTIAILPDDQPDIAVIKFNGGQILLYLGQHHLLIQTKLLDKAYVKVKLWQQEELVGRTKIVNKDVSRIIRFPATMSNSTINLQLYYRNYDVVESHQQNLEQKQTILMTPQKAYAHVYINQNTIYIPYKIIGEQRMQVFIKKGNEIIHEGITPLTHKLDKGRYKIQFRKKVIFHQEWYTYKVWTQELTVQHKSDILPEQKLIKRGNKITIKLPEAHHKRQYGIIANANYINNHDETPKQIHTTTYFASTIIIISLIFLFIFLLIMLPYIIHHIRRRNRHDEHSAFSLVSLF